MTLRSHLPLGQVSFRRLVFGIKLLRVSLCSHIQVGTVSCSSDHPRCMCNRAQARLASGEDVFGPLIQRYLLQNTHKVTVELLPDAKLGAKVEQDEKARLKVLLDRNRPKDMYQPL